MNRTTIHIHNQILSEIYPRNVRYKKILKWHFIKFYYVEYGQPTNTDNPEVLRLYFLTEKEAKEYLRFFKERIFNFSPEHYNTEVGKLLYK